MDSLILLHAERRGHGSRADFVIRAAWATFAIASVLLTAGCGAVHPTVAELRAVPGATAMYPGSGVLFGLGASEGRHTPFDASPAMLFATYCATSQQPEVTRWFGAALRREGWLADPNPVGTTDSDVEGVNSWIRGDRRFTLQLLSSAYATRASAGHPAPCTTAYRTTVM